MTNRNLLSTAIVAVTIFASSCNTPGKNSGSALPNDGQLHGVSTEARWIPTRPFGMVYVPPGTFHMGPSDEDMNYSFTARNKSVSISGFWMDATEITNNEYRQFTNWVRDSIAAKLTGTDGVKGVKYIITSPAPDSHEYIDWKKVKTMNWSDKNLLEKAESMFITADNRIFGKKEIDSKKIIYKSETFDYKAAAQNKDPNKQRKDFITKEDIMIYPDTLCWVRDFAYSYNEPMAKKYFSHSAFGNYPVVGVNWVQATAFCEWRTMYLNSFLESKKRTPESDFRLPTEAQWEYAARGGLSQVQFPWGGPYLRNKKGCILANFKPGRGNYPEDGGFYTVRADAYWPNNYGLYNMAGNVAEWTSSLYYEGGYNFQHDMNPDIRWNAKRPDPSKGIKGDGPRMFRKVLRGGSWKDVGHYLETSTRCYEYQDTAKSYIGFRCVIDLPTQPIRRR